MTDSCSLSSTSRYPKYHEGYLHHKDSDCKVYREYWVVLRGNVLFIFKTSDTKHSKHIGLLELDDSTEVTCKHDKKGFYLDVHTKKKHSANKFKSSSENGRDLWASYILGIATGTFPVSGNLLPGQITCVQDAIHDWTMERTHHGPRSLRSSHTPSTASSGFGDIGSVRTGHSGEGSGGSGDSLYRGGPVMNHIFESRPPDQPATNTVPSWFFSNCSRQKAERVLEVGVAYGNVLMRESVTFKDNGSYVISLRRDTPMGAEFEHFEVIRVAAGYKINVENEHRPLKCLQDVMDFFLETAGPSYTRPFTCNSLETLDINGPDYKSRISTAGPTSVLPLQHQPALSYQGVQPSEKVTQMLDSVISENLSGWGENNSLYENQTDIGVEPQGTEQPNYVNEEEVEELSNAQTLTERASQIDWQMNIRPNQATPALTKTGPSKRISISSVDEPASVLSSVQSAPGELTEIARKAQEMAQRRSASASSLELGQQTTVNTELPTPPATQVKPPLTVSQQTTLGPLNPPKSTPVACPVRSPPPVMARTVKTAPQTRPKPVRRATCGDIMNPSQPIQEHQQSESGIVEEDHTTVRDALAKFDGGAHDKRSPTDRRQSTGMLKPPNPVEAQPQASQTLRPPRSMSQVAATPEEPPSESHVTSKQLTREQFKQQLESLIGGTSALNGPKSPSHVSSPSAVTSTFPPQLPKMTIGKSRDPHSPLPPPPQTPATQDLVYSEPVT